GRLRCWPGRSDILCPRKLCSGCGSGVRGNFRGQVPDKPISAASEIAPSRERPGLSARLQSSQPNSSISASVLTISVLTFDPYPYPCARRHYSTTPTPAAEAPDAEKSWNRRCWYCAKRV